MSRIPDEIIKGLIIGLQRDLARSLDVFTNDTGCRHGAWYIANCGFGLSCEQVGRAQNVTKQAVSEACQRITDRMDDRGFERQMIDVAESFGVSL